ncbi:replication initiator protein A [Cohaesibacter haloalkalitolerans]|uniref:replication initiator protein A n=1 Tax=Cohaesibacter haloalkalitolerans TaxID=1162980 RepID=UPI000E650E66|nr:replication initiator protein A [Cohaesibacter haloalkalitolerans]
MTAHRTDHSDRREERGQLSPFVISSSSPCLRDQRDLMERPFFSLAKSPRLKPICYKQADIEIQVFGMPDHGMATIWDADILIWAASQIVAAENAGEHSSRLLHFTPYQLLRGIRRQTGNRQYCLLRASLARLQSTVIATTIRNGTRWRCRQFSWINEWEERTTMNGRVEGMEFILPEWFYNGVMDRSLVLSIDPAYFRLKGGIERWLYRIARKHVGHQREGWHFDIAHLHRKSGSLARVSDFALAIRRIARQQPLPGYRLGLGALNGREGLWILPVILRTGTVDKAVDASGDTIGTSHAETIGTSDATLSAHQTHEQAVSACFSDGNASRNLSNSDSNSFSSVSKTSGYLKQSAASMPPAGSRRTLP